MTNIRYVPVLKLKQAEKDAMRSLSARLRRVLMPLVEFVRPGKDVSVHEHIAKSLVKSVSAFGPCPRILLDTRELASYEADVAKEAFRMARHAGLAFTPVTGIGRTADLGPALAAGEGEIALRVARRDIHRQHFDRELLAFLHRHGLAASNIDIVLDMGSVNDLIDEGIQALASEMFESLPKMADWRSVTLSGSAFPLSTGKEKYAATESERTEWTYWRRENDRRRKGRERPVTYSDCAIQHPKGVEDFDPSTMSAATVIRYTTGETWVLVRGESTKNRPVRDQSQILAEMLVSRENLGFRGPQHCGACAEIARVANGKSDIGSLGGWRRVGTLHHITTVLEELDAGVEP